jgi:undecaprenyl diphosphate synthase
MHLAVVGDVVAVVAPGRREEGQQPDGGDAQALQRVERFRPAAEIADAVRSIAEDVKSGQLDPAAIDERTISNKLYTSGMPDPDLLIRTAGEMRLSNYLLWQISYAELYVTDTLWPDFELPDLHKALDNYAQRNRKFGGLNKVA